MSLTGQLNDLSLGELIEFFCNQRKTGRLKVDYALAPGVFFIKEGHLVDAKVGALNGVEAVYFALSLPSASFDFSAGVLSSRHTIQEPWARVVLEGLRRIDEGIPAAPNDAFVGDDALDEATLDYLNCVEEAKAAKPAAQEQARETAATAQTTTAAAAPDDNIEEKIESVLTEASPLAMTVESAAETGGRRKVMALAAAAALVLVCAVAAIPVSRRLMRAKAAAAAPAPEATEQTQAASQPEGASGFSTGEATDAAAAATPTPDTAAAEEAARREQREREQRERARKQREEAARRAAESEEAAGATKPEAKPAAGPKTVRVQITYDEAGRVTQAAAVGTSPGAEAYAATAVRVARGRRFPAGKAGSTIVTIPIN